MTPARGCPRLASARPAHGGAESGIGTRMWIAGSVAGLVGLALVVVVVLLDPPGGTLRPVRRVSDGAVLPTPGAFRSRRFASTFRGYDPREVDAHLADLAEAYERLYLAAGPSVLARASRVPASDAETPPTDA